MRARYYSPDMRRFVNADILHGKISEAVTLNRYAYANGNPVSFLDPFGLSAERTEIDLEAECNRILEVLGDIATVATFIAIVSMMSVSKNSLLRMVSAGVSDVVILATIVGLVYSVLPEDLQVGFVETLSGVTIESHYNRNQKNIDFPDVYDETFYEEWNHGVLASCHQFTSPNRTNWKVVSPDGKYEVIYDENYIEVIDVRDVGTYNMADPGDSFGHFRKDVLPWLFWGNSPEDTTTMLERFNAFLIDGIQDGSRDLVMKLFHD